LSEDLAYVLGRMAVIELLKKSAGHPSNPTHEHGPVILYTEISLAGGGLPIF
jgi:hypothetical protein